MDSEPARSSPHAASFVLAIVGIAGGVLLLVLTLRLPPLGLCDPPVGLADAWFALAQALAVVGLSSARRLRIGGFLAFVAALSWALLSGWVLLMRQTAGDVHAIDPHDLLMGCAGGLGLLLLVHGMAMRVEQSSAAGFAGMLVLAVALSLGYVALLDDVPRGRTWKTWAQMGQIDDAIGAWHASNHRWPEEGRLFEDLGASGKSLPRTDAWNRTFVYKVTGDTYTLRSLGAMGEDGPRSKGAVSGYADDLVTQGGASMSWPSADCASASTTPRAVPGPSEAPAPAGMSGVIDLRHRRR